MHRITGMPRSLLLTALLGVAVFHGLNHSRAQAQDRAAAVSVPIGGSQILEMSKKQRIKDIDNRDHNVARVDFVAGADYRKVMVIGGSGAGLTRVVLTDNDGNKEAFDIVVGQDVEFLRRVLAQAAPTANIQILQGTSNTLVLTGTVEQAADVGIIMHAAEGVVGPKNVVNAMRVGGVQEVQLDVVIARVARSEARNLGLSFLQNGANHYISSTLGTGGGGNLTGAVSNSLGNVSSSLLGSPNLLLGIFNTQQSFLPYIEALRTENLVKVIAQPKICTLSGQPANFLSGGEQATPQVASGSAGGGAVAGVQFQPFGTTVRFLPLVLGGGKIYLEVEPEFSFIDTSPLLAATVNGGTTFGKDTQRIHTSAVLEDGQTLAIGGMILHQVNGTSTTLPVLGDLPYFGCLFRSITYSNSEEELIILITVHLVDAMGCDQLPKCLPGEETRSPDDYELFLEGILEAPRGPREVFHGCKYVPAYKNGPTANMFPCPNCNGPRGACDFGQCSSPSCSPDCGCANGANGVVHGLPAGQLAPAVQPQPPMPLPAPTPLPTPAPKQVPAPQQVPAPPQELAPQQGLPKMQGSLQPQTLPEVRTQYQRPADSVVFETVPAETVPVMQVNGTSGVILVNPAPLDDPR
jgi:pilus assembly protein CpaC